MSPPSADSGDAVPPSSGKAAFHSLKSGKNDCGLTLLEIDLETGRYHQIRAQLSAIGFPIAGDEKYGAKQVSDNGDIALHHARLEVTHPTRKKPVIIEAPYPEDSPWWGTL